LLTEDESGHWVATCRDVPEAMTDGVDLNTVTSDMGVALGAALAGYLKQGRCLPIPSVPELCELLVPVAPLVAAKLALISAMSRQGVSNSELARRLGVTEAVVRRMVDPDHASRLDRLVEALACLGVCLAIEAVPDASAA
jgi:antitoxin HicB